MITGSAGPQRCAEGEALLMLLIGYPKAKAKGHGTCASLGAFLRAHNRTQTCRAQKYVHTSIDRPFRVASASNGIDAVPSLLALGEALGTSLGELVYATDGMEEDQLLSFLRARLEK